MSLHYISIGWSNVHLRDYQQSEVQFISILPGQFVNNFEFKIQIPKLTPKIRLQPK